MPFTTSFCTRPPHKELLFTPNLKLMLVEAFSKVVSTWKATGYMKVTLLSPSIYLPVVLDGAKWGQKTAFASSATDGHGETQSPTAMWYGMEWRHSAFLLIPGSSHQVLLILSDKCIFKSVSCSPSSLLPSPRSGLQYLSPRLEH